MSLLVGCELSCECSASFMCLEDRVTQQQRPAVYAVPVFGNALAIKVISPAPFPAISLLSRAGKNDGVFGRRLKLPFILFTGGSWWVQKVHGRCRSVIRVNELSCLEGFIYDPDIRLPVRVPLYEDAIHWRGLLADVKWDYVKRDKYGDDEDLSKWLSGQD